MKSSRQASRRKLLASETDDSDRNTMSEKKIRICSRAGCPGSAPICFARATTECCGNGYTSRWYHLSAGEHFCNECFEHFYRSSRPGYEIYEAWKRMWSKYGSTDSGIKYYMSDQQLPYWVQCNLCQKWRQIFRETQLTLAFLKSYKCPRVLKHHSQQDSCGTPEDYRIELAKDLYTWPYQMTCSSFAKNAIYAPYVRLYYQDSVGISPSDTSVHKYSEEHVDICQYLQPFEEVDAGVAMTLPPDHLSEDESADFPEFSGIFLKFYLIVRNTAIALWNINVKKWVTRKRCMNYIIIRGLPRVWLSYHVNRILLFLTIKGFINFGAAHMPKEVDYIPNYDSLQKNPVIIVGGGLAGLTTARQLTNLGIQVTILEASDTIGGRALNCGSSSFPVQSHIIVGSYNNPTIVMCKQSECKLQEINDHCVLLSEDGNVIDDKTDKRMQFHFEAMLDINRQLRKEQEKDASLYDKFTELHEQFKDESGIRFSKLEESLLHFHMSNLEFACGSNLANISSLYWDQNEDSPQFRGPLVLIQDDFGKILDKLADGIHIVKNAEVCAIDYSAEDTIIVKCASGEQFSASKVVVTVPLYTLKTNKIAFCPALPEYKNTTLSCGHVEKVMLQFTDKFWNAVVQQALIFGRVLAISEERGLFDVFYDTSVGEQYILTSYVSGNAVDIIKDKTDQQVIEMCMQLLKTLFPKQEIPKPSQYYVSRWYQQEHIKMAFSYIPVNAGANAFENMEKDVDGQIFFAGEATHKQFHQTLTGAYISGMREAEKVYRALTTSS